MDFLYEMLKQELQTKGFSTLLLFGAIVWLNRSNREVIKALNKEREDRIQKLEADVGECKKDRASLWDKVVDLALQHGPREPSPLDTTRRS